MLRMSPTKFEEPLKMMARSITKSSMKWEAISAEEILFVMLRLSGKWRLISRYLSR